MSMILNTTPDKEYLSIPSVALGLAGFSGEEQLELHFEKDALAVLKKKLTARDMIGAITGLQEIAADLVKQLVLATDKTAVAEQSNGCEKKCDYAKTCDLSIPPCILAEANIPFNRPLLAYVEDGAIVIKGEEEDSLEEEIPDELLQSLVKAGVNVGGLSLLLESGRVVYGE